MFYLDLADHMDFLMKSYQVIHIILSLCTVTQLHLYVVWYIAVMFYLMMHLVVLNLQMGLLVVTLTARI